MMHNIASQMPHVRNTSTYKDFFFLGGGSLFFLFLFHFFIPMSADNFAESLTITLFLANFINHPHFAISYVIFYSNFNSKISKTYIRVLRAKYVFIGLIFPIIFSLFFLHLVLNKNINALGITANIMFFMVGWHYVKQGYGMLMLEAAKQKKYFSEKEKSLLLKNAYLIWILSWLLANSMLENRAPLYLGIPYIAFDVPLPLLYMCWLLAIASTIFCAIALFRKHKAGQRLPWNGVIAYGVSLYIWLLIKEPIVLLWIPLFHSLQYLYVSWNFQKNKYISTGTTRLNARYKPALLAASILALGYFFFFQIPWYLDGHVNYDREVFGNYLFMYIFWIFINIHHYFLDSVMWRKENPDLKKYLFN